MDTLSSKIANGVIDKSKALNMHNKCYQEFIGKPNLKDSLYKILMRYIFNGKIKDYSDALISIGMKVVAKNKQKQMIKYADCVISNLL